MKLTNYPWNFALGLFIGLGAGTCLGIKLTKYIKKKQNEIEVQEVIEYYDQKIKELIPKKPFEVNKIEELKSPVVQDDSPIPKAALEPDGTPKKIMDYAPKIKEADYTNYGNIYKVHDKNGEVVNNPSIREDIKVNPYPHKITYDEFIKNNNYSKVNLIWYEQSNVFATVGDELTDYTEEYFGVHNINEFGASSNSGYGHDAWTLVLRDELTKTDFQIIYNGDDDWETVLANTGGDHSD